VTLGVRQPANLAWISRKRAGIVGEMMKTEIISENTPPPPPLPAQESRRGNISSLGACLQS